MVEQLRPDFNNPEPDGDEQPEVEEQELPEKRRITRDKGLRHVHVYNVKLGKTQQENVILQPKSQLKQVGYKRSNNFNIKLFRAENRFNFYARKKALESHYSNCNINLCEICELYEKIKSFKFSPESLSRYNSVIENLPRKKLSEKSVRFEKSTNFKEHSGKLKLSLSKVFAACESNISFQELTLMSCNF